ncbi:VIT1/CCC1 transporter family protein [Streptomyces sp. NPDC093261]|uniref:VIT1/CCC1 transporter family protein n=1 Tax=Streptomyces sp. NPDC093261 TaxID=3366037 RepID=UPI00380F5C39
MSDALGRLANPVVFGILDGLTTLLGVLLSEARYPGLILHTAIAVSVAGAVGMGFGQWLSSAEGHLLRVAKALAIGASTACGSILPALPYAALPLGWARPASAAIFLALGCLISLVRAGECGFKRSAAETFGAMAAVFIAVYASQLLTPGGM